MTDVGLTSRISAQPLSSTRIKKDGRESGRWTRTPASIDGIRAQPILNAKKRFVWMPAASIETSLVCYLSSPAVGKTAVSLFFRSPQGLRQVLLRRHHPVLEQVGDRASPELLPDRRRRRKDWASGIPATSQDPHPGRRWQEVQPRLPWAFRFSGDLFARYWTCYAIEYLQPPFRTSAGSPSSWLPDDSESRDSSNPIPKKTHGNTGKSSSCIYSTGTSASSSTAPGAVQSFPQGPTRIWGLARMNFLSPSLTARTTSP